MHLQRLADIEANYLPHGSGIDTGARVDYENSTYDRVVIVSSFHVMDDAGFYTHWRDFTVTVTPAFGGINVDITGLEDDSDNLLEYLNDVFYECLVQLL